MAWSEEFSICRKHLDENPQRGICASCLRDRLSGIASGNNNSAAYYYYFHYSSASSSGESSPARRHHQRFASDIVDSIYLAVSGDKSGLKKSRSMAFASRKINGEREDDDHGVSSNRKKEKKKGGFWNKLLLFSSVNKLVK